MTSKDVTSSLRVARPSVTVRANPADSGQKAAVESQGQIAYLDENGNLTSAPLPGVPKAAIQLPAAVEAEQTLSPVDPNAVMVDISHIVSVVTAHRGGNGKIITDCTHSSAIATADAGVLDHAARMEQPHPAQSANEDRK
jgi:hypothetical protein